MYNAKRRMMKIMQILNAWETQAPEATFGGMTLAQFKAAIKSAFDAQDSVTESLTDLVARRAKWSDASLKCLEIAYRAVDGVKSDEAYGNNSPLYNAMGYVRKSQRKSGRTWKTAAAAENTETPQS